MNQDNYIKNIKLLKIILLKGGPNRVPTSRDKVSRNR